MPTKEWKQANDEKMRAYRKAYYERNREKEITRSKKNGKRRAKEIRAFLTTYKVGKGCEACGENHPACLDLHHVNAAQKTINPSNMAKHGWSLDRIEKELYNCVVLCSNCHRKEHYMGVDES